MIVIATDEAGYGPKLGPLVVGASVWKVPDTVDFSTAFREVSAPFDCDGLKVVVDDSKSVFRPRSARRGGSENQEPAYRKLEWVALAGCRWSGVAQQSVSLVGDLAPEEDGTAIQSIPWLKDFSEAQLATEQEAKLINHWEQGSVSLIDMRARVVTAQQFNRRCQEGLNKADLLAETTLGLVREMLNRLPGGENDIRVFCDRFGGRRFYAPPIQDAFDSALVSVIAESKSDSAYQVPFGDRSFAIRFTVKGDSFTPVAFSSMIAKYLREKAMESFNAYFQSRWSGKTPLKPTAGYPVDADRYLNDIRPIIDREQIAVTSLVRSR